MSWTTPGKSRIPAMLMGRDKDRSSLAAENIDNIEQG
jgi:hypothetical protein